MAGDAYQELALAKRRRSSCLGYQTDRSFIEPPRAIR